MNKNETEEIAKEVVEIIKQNLSLVVKSIERGGLVLNTAEEAPEQDSSMFCLRLPPGEIESVNITNSPPVITMRFEVRLPSSFRKDKNTN